jgi:hypothetical protein
MSNQLTPIQEAIDKITELQNNENITGFTKRAYSICLDILTDLLPKEQQVIEDSYNNGEQHGHEYTSITYYESKFNNNESK